MAERAACRRPHRRAGGAALRGHRAPLPEAPPRGGGGRGDRRRLRRIGLPRRLLVARARRPRADAGARARRARLHRRPRDADRGRHDRRGARSRTRSTRSSSPADTQPITCAAREPVLELCRALAARGRPVAAICHGPWVLCSAGLLRGRRATGHWVIRPDVEGAGATWVDEPCVVDGPIVTARFPHDLGPFCRSIARAGRRAAVLREPEDGPSSLVFPEGASTSAGSRQLREHDFFLVLLGGRRMADGRTADRRLARVRPRAERGGHGRVSSVSARPRLLAIAQPVAPRVRRGDARLGGRGVRGRGRPRSPTSGGSPERQAGAANGRSTCRRRCPYGQVELAARSVPGPRRPLDRGCPRTLRARKESVRGRGDARRGRPDRRRHPSRVRAAPAGRRRLELFYAVREEILAQGVDDVAYGPDCWAVGPELCGRLGERRDAEREPRLDAAVLGLARRRRHHCAGYRSDVGRTIWVGEAPPRSAEALAVLREARAAGRRCWPPAAARAKSTTRPER